MFTLTAAQQRCLDFIRAHSAENGEAPSYDEMREALGLASKSGVNRLINALEERGAIRRLPNRRRAIEIVGSTPNVVTIIPRLEAEKVIRAIEAAHGEVIDEDGVTIICTPEELRATVMKALG